MHSIESMLASNCFGRADIIEALLLSNFHLEKHRNNSVRTRNLRRAAIQGLFGYMANRQPELLLNCQKVQSTPAKRMQPRMLDFLEQAIFAALLAAPDLSTRID